MVGWCGKLVWYGSLGEGGGGGGGVEYSGGMEISSVEQPAAHHSVDDHLAH